MRNKYLLPIITVSIVVNLWLAWQAWAGSPDSPGAPNATQSYTLQDLYNRLTAGTAGTPSAFTEPSTAPGAGTMHTLNDLMDAAPALDNANGAALPQVLTGRTFWGLTGDQWGLRTGTMPNRGAVAIIPGTASKPIAAGYHNGSGFVAGDADLTAANIKSGVNLFGVTGTAAPCDCTGGTLTGTRWCNNGDGTVTDLLGDTTNNNIGQCLVWLRNANCSANLNGINKTSTLTWDNAGMWSSFVSSGNCGLTDGSTNHEWRLPTIAELQGITHGVNSVSSSSMQAFTGVQSSYYWSSTNAHYNLSFAWYVYMSDGYSSGDDKTNSRYVWPVRGGR